MAYYSFQLNAYLFSTPQGITHYLPLTTSYLLPPTYYLLPIKYSLRHILRSTSLLGGVQVLHLLLSVVRNKVTAVFIGSAGIGLADLYARSAEMVGHLTQLGLGMSGVRRIAQLYEEEPAGVALRNSIAALRSWVLVTAVLGGGVMLLLSPLLALLLLKDQGRWIECCALAPLVFCATLFSGEMTLLKATHQLKKLALCTAVGAVVTLCLTVPLYVLFGSVAIIPVLTLSAFSLLCIYLWATTRHYPYALNFRHESFLKEGLPLLRLGVSFVLAGVVASAAELAVRSFINWQSSEAFVGFYSVGFTLIVSYARIIFVAVDADYYPRLTAVVEHHQEMNTIINRQTDALVMLMTPFLITFALGLPYIIRLLYTEEFLCVAPMVLAALCYMFFKAVYTPPAYLSIAKGDSKIYLVMEVLYNIVFMVAVVGGFHYGGLLGAGVGLTIANLYDLLAISIFYSYRYKYRMERATLCRTLMQFLLLASTIGVCVIPNVWVRYGVGVLLLLASLGLGYKVWRDRK